MSRKSICSAFSAGSNAWESAARAIARQQQQQSRTFSSTPSRNAGGVAHFTPTSSPALDNLLSEIRYKIILPAYLPREQRKVIFDPKHENRLRSDPIEMEIDGEAIKFRHMNPLKGDIPNTRKTLISAIESFQTPADFANLRPLLEGLRYANRHIPHTAWVKMIRIAGSRGYIYEIIEAARRVRRTGFKLDTSEKVNEVLHYIQLKAVESKYDEAVTRQALRWAEIVVELLQVEGHQPRKSFPPTGKRALQPFKTPVPDPEFPLFRDPQVLAAPLHLTAALIAKHGAEEEMVKKASTLARNITTLWPKGKGLLQLHSKAAYEHDEAMAYLKDPSKLVAMVAPLARGLEMALPTLGSDQVKEISQILSPLQNEVEEARAEIGEGSRGQVVYDKLSAADAQTTR